MSSTIDETLRRAYKDYYRGPETSDSPDRSRLLMAQNIASRLLMPELLSAQKAIVLDLGAGKQSVEKILRMLANSSAGRGKYAGLHEKLHNTGIITLDIAAGLSSRKPSWVSHVMADSATLPIRKESIDLAVSNHSIDMLRGDMEVFKTALSDVERVLKPGGSVLFYYHHAQLFERQCSYYQEKYAESPQAQYFDISATNPFYGDRQDIVNDLASVGLSTTTLNLETDGQDSWWCVEAQKASMFVD